MTDVSVLGLGNMGSALARAFMAAGWTVAGWNRTPGKADDLTQAVETPAEAFQASPVSVICVSENKVVREWLENESLAVFLAGRTVVNLTTGTPEEATQLEKLFNELGANYLAGIIPLYPEYIGKADVGLVYGGSDDVWNKNKGLLSALGGDSWYAGESVGAPAALDMAVCIGFYHTALGSFLESATYARTQGVPFESVLRVSRDLVDIMKHQMAIALDQMQNGDFQTKEANIDVHLHGCEMTAEAMSALGHDRVLHLSPLVADLRRAQDAGLGRQSLAAMTTQLVPNT